MSQLTTYQLEVRKPLLAQPFLRINWGVFSVPPLVHLASQNFPASSAEDESGIRDCAAPVLL